MTRAIHNFASVFLLIGCVFIGFLSAYTLIDLTINFGDYRFGTEVAGWRYRSDWIYAITACIELASALTAVFAPLIFSREKTVTLFRVAVVLSFLVSVVVNTSK
jgi:hypothetical protein